MGLALVYKKSTAEPQFNGAPQISGSLLVGQTLTGSYNITNATSSVTLSWMSYKTIERLEPIERSTSSQYTLTSDDADRYIEFIVTATNNAGTTVRSSAMSSQVLDDTVPLPQFTVGATIAGQPKVGFTLTANYTAVDATSVTFQWQSSTDNITFGNISGATSQTYTLTAGEQGDYVRVVVTATNASGSVSSTSAATGQVAAADAELPAPAGAPPGAIPLNAANLASRTLSDGAVLLNGSGAYYYLVGDMTFTGAAFVIDNSNITLDFNGCVVDYNTGNGTSIWNALYAGTFTGEMRNAQKCKANFNGIWGLSELADTAYGSEFVTNRVTAGFVVKNGTLRSSGEGDLTHAITCYNPKGMGWTISGMRVESGIGKLAACAWGAYNQWKVYDSVLIAKSHAIFGTVDRQALPCCVHSYGGEPSDINRSVIIGGSGGIYTGGGSHVRNSFISHYGYITNGWGYTQTGGTETLVEDCIVLPYNGRGIYYDGTTSTSNTARNNVILSWEYRNAEYGDGLTASAFKTRYSSAGHSYYGNHCLSVAGRRSGDAATITWSGTYPKTAAGPTKLTSAVGMWNAAYGEDARPITSTTDNIFRAIYYGDIEVVQNYAAALGFLGPGATENNLTGSHDETQHNEFYSNMALVCTSEMDGYAYSGGINAGNKFYWQTGEDAYTAFVAAVDAKLATFGLTPMVLAVADEQKALVLAKLSAAINQADAGLRGDRAFWRNDYLNGTGFGTERCTLTNPTLGDGVDHTSIARFQAVGQNNMALRIARTHTIQVLDGVTPLANVTVTVTPDQIDTPIDDVTTTTTNAAGVATITLYEHARTRVGGVVAESTLQTGTSSTIAVAGVGSATLTHASLPATIDLTT